MAINASGLTILNVYRPPGDPVVPRSTNPSTLHALLQFSPPPNTVIGDDFNTLHPLWQPDVESHTTTAGASALIEWLETHGLALCIEPGTPTRRHNTLDLVFSDVPSNATVEDHLTTTSDHATILTRLDWAEAPPRPKLGTTDWDKARTLLNLPGSDRGIDEMAEDLVYFAQTAIQGASEYNTRRLPRTPWWTPELTSILQQTRQHPSLDYLPLRRAISRAKASYWKERIDQATKPTDAYALVRWHRRTDQLSAPLSPSGTPRSRRHRTRRAPSSVIS